MRIRHFLMATLALALLAPAALAQDLTAEPAADGPVEARFTYSGLLTAPDGAPVADGARALVFRGYDSAEAAAAGAAPAWQEAHDAAVVGGRFLTVLGSKAAVPDEVRYLTVSVDGEAASGPMRLDRGATAEAGFAPGNTLQDSYDNGRVIDTSGGLGPLQIRGTLNSIGLIVRDITPVFITTGLTRFRLTSTGGAGRIWEYRVYGAGNPDRDPGTFSIADATGGGADGFIMLPGVGEDVLTLTGQTIQGGSVNNTADLKLYTTPGTGGPGTNVVTHRTSNFNGNGAASHWFGQNGIIHTRIEPDAGGGGGFFNIISGSGGSALVVDGNVSGGSQTRIGTGVGSSFFNDTVAGNASVVLPASAVNATEILNEAGTASALNSGPIALATGAFTATLVRTINAPTDGYVIAMAVGELAVNHSFGTADTFQMSVSRDCGTPSAPNTQQANWQVPSPLPTATYRNIASAVGLFTVSAGSTMFCTVVSVSAASVGPFIDDQNLVLLFVPTAYGGISSNLGDEPGRREVDEPAGAPLSASDIEAERAASIQAALARVAAEQAAMQARIEALQASMDGNER